MKVFHFAFALSSIVVSSTLAKPAFPENGQNLLSSVNQQFLGGIIPNNPASVPGIQYQVPVNTGSVSSFQNGIPNYPTNQVIQSPYNQYFTPNPYQPQNPSSPNQYYPYYPNPQNYQNAPQYPVFFDMGNGIIMDQFGRQYVKPNVNQESNFYREIIHNLEIEISKHKKNTVLQTMHEFFTKSYNKVKNVTGKLTHGLSDPVFDHISKHISS